MRSFGTALVRLTVIAAALAASLTSASLTSASLTSSALAKASTPTCQPWNQVQPGSGTLVGAAVLPDCEEWAVGENSQQTLALHLFGQGWTQVPSPDPGGKNRGNTLASVAATGSSSGWAVGNYSNGKTSRTLILRWDGAVWSRVASPNPGGPKNAAALFGVAALKTRSAPGARTAWAVGNYRNGKARRTLILGWNGKNWTQVPSPNPGGPTHDSRLTSVAVVSARDAWAAGYYQTAQVFRRTLILHWNGKNWTRVPSPDPGGPSNGNLLFGVAATSASDAWAVGYDTSRSGATTLVLHWNGKRWSRMQSPDKATGANPRIDQLQGVTATSADNAWAVGYYQLSGAGFYTLILHWNGKFWHAQSSPNPAGDNDFLLNVAASSASSAWAVGGSSNGFGEQNLVLHWNGTTWQS
ncbi:MAG TPA: hypothetical protein VFI65_05555 [Streptosporangiaceae bacterium]|nr:hypothetical protein [Streptosporangiaceae bacterium]